MRWLILLVGLLATTDTGPVLAQAADTQQQEPKYYEFMLTDGTRIVGQIRRETSEKVIAISPQGVRFEIPRHLIRSRWTVSEVGPSQYERPDANYSRLLLAPTGRPLRPGEGYLSSHYLVFPGFAYGVTENLSVMAGFSIIPGFGFGDQMKYIVPRIGWRSGERLSFSAGTLLMSADADGDGGSAGLGFVVTSFGEVDRSLTVGLGMGWTNEKNRDAEFMDGPILVLGGSYRLRRTIAVVSENWLILNGDVRLSEQPFGLALRLLRESLSIDVGAILIGETLSEGFPIPWLSFTYHFSKPR